MGNTNREILSTISEILVSNSKGDVPHYVALDEIRKLMQDKPANNYTEMQDKINKTRDYLDYIEKHYHNVQAAWRIVQDKCSDMRFIYDDFVYTLLDLQIKNHDMSKLSKEEFIQYRKEFYPTKDEINLDTSGIMANRHQFLDAWESHKTNNDHHWQNWTNVDIVSHPYQLEINCAHMVIDWIAMGMDKENTALEYYEHNIFDINIPEWADKMVREICERVYGEDNNESI